MVACRPNGDSLRRKKFFRTSKKLSFTNQYSCTGTAERYATGFVFKLDYLCVRCCYAKTSNCRYVEVRVGHDNELGYNLIFSASFSSDSHIIHCTESQSVHPSDFTIDSGQSQSANMDEYICPLCETECTCSRPKLPVLKIKLTMPPSMVKSDSDSVIQPPKRKRGRPPKSLASVPPVTQQLPKRKPGRPRKNPLPPLSDRFPTFVSASALSASNSSASASDASDSLEDDVDSEIEKEEEKLIRREERQRGKREKKVERARVRRQQQNRTARRESGRQYQHQQAKRESNQGRHDLLHSDDGDTHPHNEWVIRTRRPSDAGLTGMDIDASSSSSTVSSDSSSDEEEDDDDGEDADEEPEEVMVDAEVEDEEEDGPSYTGLATGWSDSEESSFDADLFFANLSDSHSSHEGSDDDGDDTASERDFPIDYPGAHPTMEFGGQMEFEVTEAWDGQLVFTNGIHHAPSFGFGSIFSPYNNEPSVNAFIETLSPPPSQSQNNTDVDVQMEHGTDVGEPTGMSSDEEVDYSGNTTDEDLVGPDQLPNAKALKMFRLPHPHSSFDAPFSFDLTGLCGVDPLSTVSPSGSPTPRSRIPAKRRSSLLSGRVPFSPSPSDILTGNVGPLNTWGEVDEIDEDVSMSPDSSSEITQKVNGPEANGPVARPFSQVSHNNHGEVFVVDDEHKVAPSPYHKKTSYSRSKSVSDGVRKHKNGIGLDEVCATRYISMSSEIPAVSFLVVISPQLYQSLVNTSVYDSFRSGHELVIGQST